MGLALVLGLSACSGAPDGSRTTDPPQTAASAEPSPSAGPDIEASDGLFPDVVAAKATQSADGTWDFTATLSSPYDSPARYADAWRVLAPDGSELGVRELTHDHAGEQPFTRSLLGVDVPTGVGVVTIEGRDQLNGWGGATIRIELRP